MRDNLAVTTSRTSRPELSPPAAKHLYDWLAKNGIDEWIPAYPKIVVSGGQLTYTAFAFSGPRGYDAEHIALTPDKTDVEYEMRTVPLLVMPDAETIAAAKAVRCTIAVRT